MNVNQKLADIFALTQYVAAHVNAQGVDTQGERIAEVANAAVDVNETLRSLNDSLETIKAADVMAHAEATVAANAAILEKLERVAHDIHKQGVAHQSGVDELNTVCEQYTKAIQDNMERFAGIVTRYEADMGLSRDTSHSIKSAVLLMDNKILSQAQLRSEIDRVEAKLNEAIVQDERFASEYQKGVDILDASMARANDAVHRLERNLSLIDTDFKSAISRMEVVDVKLDAIAEAIRGGKE